MQPVVEVPSGMLEQLVGIEYGVVSFMWVEDAHIVDE
jgi:hypothetical protein